MRRTPDRRPPAGERLVVMRSSRHHEPDRPKSLSRRRFLGGIGVTAAGAAAVATAPAISGMGRADAATPADRFGRMFPNLPPFIPTDDRRRAALIDIGKPGGI